MEQMKLTGNMVKRLMRRHQVTIRQVKAQHRITLKRIREVRAHGVDGFVAAEWLFIITGKWPEAYQIKRNSGTHCSVEGIKFHPFQLREKQSNMRKSIVRQVAFSKSASPAVS